MAFDALRAAEAIVQHANAGKPPDSELTHVEGVVVSVERGIVELRDTVVGGMRRLIAPPLIAEGLKRSTGVVTLVVDDSNHVVTHIR
ncbi:MAG: hypothetical protein ABR591_08430 [Candidatus Velthaea sp.]